MPIKGAIFDLDGVIVNTVPLHFKAWQKMFKEYGHDFNMDDYLAKVDGRPRLEGAAAILTELSPKEIEKAGEIKQSYYLELIEKGSIEIFDSTIILLKAMKELGIKLAAASSSKNAVHILQKIDLLDTFDANVSGADFKKGKPDPEIFLTAAKRIDVKPEECVVFEDAHSGVQAALAGGFLCVAIDRHNNAEALQGADLMVKDLKEATLSQIINLERK